MGVGAESTVGPLSLEQSAERNQSDAEENGRADPIVCGKREIERSSLGEARGIHCGDRWNPIRIGWTRVSCGWSHFRRRLLKSD